VRFSSGEPDGRGQYMPLQPRRGTKPPAMVGRAPSPFRRQNPTRF
jgi:hypothetical protein